MFSSELHDAALAALAAIGPDGQRAKMDEKAGSTYEAPERPQHATSPPKSRPARRFRPFLFLFLAAPCVYIYAWAFSIFSHVPDMSLPSSLQAPSTISEKDPVPLEAHIMSKCPDARDCLKELILPTMVRASDKVNFTLSFIGTPTENDGISCKHGPEECEFGPGSPRPRLEPTNPWRLNMHRSWIGLGNIVLLCAASLYPDPKTYLGFSMCLIKDYHDIPQRNLIEDCALEHAIDFDKLDGCASKDDGALGVGLLRDSVRRSSKVRMLLEHYICKAF